MFGDGSLTFREFVMREPLPLAAVHDAVLEFLQGRKDAVLCGAHAVNAYVYESRMTQDVDIASARAEELAQELRAFLKQRFRIAVRVREVRDGAGFRLLQPRKPKHRRLVDIRWARELPPAKRVRRISVVTPEELIAQKVTAWVRRRGKPKAGTDGRDLAMLLLRFPELKTFPGPVLDRLNAAGASNEVLSAWREWAERKIVPEDPDDKFAW